MAKHTTFKIGGPVDFFVSVESKDALVGLLQLLDASGTPYFIVGSGSNMLVKDEGFRGVAVHIQYAKFHLQDSTIVADAGCITAEIAQQSFGNNLTGFEWGVGVPGTIGGAVRGNAGAMGGEMKDVVKEVEVYQNGEVLTLTNAECQFGYRDSVFKRGGGIVLRVTLALRKGEIMEGRKKALEYLKRRAETQPQGQSIGCIFKNPEGESAGRLIDQAGCKGVRIGDAEVSTKHCNFILNRGGASASDVLTLIDAVKTKVYDTCGVTLQEEIQIIS